MINIIPKVKELDIKAGFLKKPAIFYNHLDCDKRILKALEKLWIEE